MQDSIDAQKRYGEALDELEASFTREHSEMDEDEREEAFDDYLDTLPDNFFGFTYEDPSEIRRWYAQQKASVIERFGAEEKSMKSNAKNRNQLLVLKFAVWNIL